MTREKLEDAKALDKRINRLKKIHHMFVEYAHTMDETLIRPTRFYIVKEVSLGSISENINQGEIMFLIEAYGREIERLEQELAKL